MMLWKLKYPIIWENFLPVRLLIDLHLLIVSDVPFSLEDTFVKDVIHAINIDLSESYIITVDKIHTLKLPEDFLDYCWWVGIKPLYDFHCINLSTSSLETLKCDFSAKYDLWNQINNLVYNNYCQ